MKSFTIEREIAADGTVSLPPLPFPPGKRVEITVRFLAPLTEAELHPFQGRPFTYERPFDPVIEEAGDDLL